MSKEMVLVPKSDLVKLEEARLALWKFAREKGITDINDLVKLQNITQQVWLVANTNYPVYESKGY